MYVSDLSEEMAHMQVTWVLDKKIQPTSWNFAKLMYPQHVATYL